MAPKVKLNLKDKVEDDEMDLSMCELQEVPVKDIAIYKKVYSLDLSNNLLTSLPKLFATLTNITKLDLSKNQLNSLPENFGDLQKLRHLDLYKNNLEHLPLTFGKLKALKWLDLKDNPLVPAIKETAGLCIDGKECQACAKKIVNFYSKLSANIEEDLNTREKQREKDKQANDLAQQKEKQKEKKKNKKEKNKQKSEGNNNGVVKETVGKTVEQKTHSSNNSNNKKTAEKINITKPTTSHSFISIFMLCVQLFVITFFILFVLTAIKFPKTVFLETKVTENYQILVTSLPENYQNHAITLGKEIGRMHNVTGENFLKLFGHIKNFQENPVYTKVTNYLTDYVLEIKQFLGNDKTVHVEK